MIVLREVTTRKGEKKKKKKRNKEKRKKEKRGKKGKQGEGGEREWVKRRRRYRQPEKPFMVTGSLCFIIPAECLMP